MPSNDERNLYLRLRGWLRDRGVRDVANLAGAMGFVVISAVRMCDDLRPQRENAQNEGHREKSCAYSLGHTVRLPLLKMRVTLRCPFRDNGYGKLIKPSLFRAAKPKTGAGFPNLTR